MLYRYAVEEKKRSKMKSFREYLDNKASNNEFSHEAFLAGMEAFERILSSESQGRHAIDFLNKMKESMPEIKSILNKYRLHDFKYVGEKPDPAKFDNTGLGSRHVDIASPGSNANDISQGHNVVMPNVADGYSQN